jgi:8-oxo-dGTP diphosphatase
MISHKGLNKANEFWNFPGGGVEKGEAIEDALKREFKEETNVEVSVFDLVIFREFVSPPLHALELYFIVNGSNQNPFLGFDPELNIIQSIKWFSWDELMELPSNQKPDFFNLFNSWQELLTNGLKFY